MQPAVVFVFVVVAVVGGVISMMWKLGLLPDSDLWIKIILKMLTTCVLVYARPGEQGPSLRNFCQTWLLAMMLDVVPTTYVTYTEDINCPWQTKRPARRPDHVMHKRMRDRRGRRMVNGAGWGNSSIAAVENRDLPSCYVISFFFLLRAVFCGVFFLWKQLFFFTVSPRSLGLFYLEASTVTGHVYLWRLLHRLDSCLKCIMNGGQDEASNAYLH